MKIFRLLFVLMALACCSHIAAAQNPYCPTGNAYLTPQTGGSPLCVPPVLQGFGPPSGACIQNSSYNQQDATPGANIWACVNGAWVQQGSTSGVPIYFATPLTSLQTSITAAVAGGYKTISVPDGTYTGAFTLPANLSIVCASRNAILTIANGANADVATVAGSNTRISNCTIDGNSANQTTAGNGINIASDVSNVVIQNTEIRFTYLRGIRLEGATTSISNISLLNNYIHDTGEDGVYSLGVVASKYLGNTIQAFGVRTTGDAFSFTFGAGATVNTGVVIANNHILSTVSTLFGIEAPNTAHTAVISGCVIEGNYLDGNSTGGSGISGFVNNCTIAGNTQVNGVGTDRTGYEITGSNNIVSHNNVDNGSMIFAGDTGVATGTTTVADNTLTNSVASASGIQVGGEVSSNMPLTDFIIAGNNVTLSNTTVNSGIQIGYAGATAPINRFKVTGNKVYCSAGGLPGHGIRLNGSASSSDIDAEDNTAIGCADGWLDNGSSGNYTNVILARNTLYGNGTPINSSFSAGALLNFGNVTTAGVAPSPAIICSGSFSLGTPTIASGAASLVTQACTGLLTTDNIQIDFNADTNAVTGYAPSSSGMLTLKKYPTADTINVSIINNTASSITAGAVTVNYRVIR